MRDLSIIVLNYNTKEMTLGCLKSVFGNRTDYRFDVWVVDNASTDGSAENISSHFPQVKMIKSERNLGYAGGNNLALSKTKKLSKYSLLLNSDTLIKPDFVDNLLKVANQSDYSVMSCKLLDERGKLQPNAGTLPNSLALAVWLSGIDDLFRSMFRIPSFQERSEKYYFGTKEVGWVSGSVMLIRNSDIDKIGLLDSNIFMYGEDVDFCWRAEKKGCKVGWTDKCRVVHFGGRSSNNANYHQWVGEFRGLIYLYRKYYGRASSAVLRMFIMFFTALRIIGFFVLGRKEIAVTYAKVIKEI